MDSFNHLIFDQIKHHVSLPAICEGDTVIAKHKNGRYYHCKVQEVRQQLFCEVNFQDGSYSNNMFPEDIEVCGLCALFNL
jgi:jumonji domain-containing protein 2